ncbi:LPS translocon maturation chaperone LptM [Nitrosospira briensis]|uniref:LPS translocon maturation chaperone LptM n=1 Tax=Nitrosospira briensis TaxID=35799 RepID=UPI0012E16DFD|nr:lipoprotein [Nitrosospira briensis]
MRTLSSVVVTVMLLSACGLKAPLYLPQKAPPQKSSTPQQSPAPQPQQPSDEEKM